MVKNKLEAAMVANGFADYDEEGRFVPNHRGETCGEAADKARTFERPVEYKWGHANRDAAPTGALRMTFSVPLNFVEAKKVGVSASACSTSSTMASASSMTMAT